jgi:hypothetical protein
MLYLDRVEDIEHAKFRALVQALMTVGAENQEAGVNAFEDYMNKAFPTLKNKKKKKEELAREVLKQWVGHGPLGITPLGNPDQRVRSKMVHKIASVETGAIAKATARIGGIRAK